MKYINIGEKINASAVSLGCMRMSDIGEKRVEEIMDCAKETSLRPKRVMYRINSVSV